MILRFNGVPPKVKHFNLPEWRVEDFPDLCWKYASYDHVFDMTNDFVRHILNQVDLVGGYKRTLVDVKVQDLTPDFYSCIEGWHVDGMPPNGVDEPDTHHLFVLNGPCTEFVGEPVDIDMSKLPTKFNNKHLDSMVPKDVSFYAVDEGAITTFTSLDFHRGVKASVPTRRLLIRVTETNGIFANNKPFVPNFGSVKG